MTVALPDLIRTACTSRNAMMGVASVYRTLRIHK
jgi:hypothetical protein